MIRAVPSWQSSELLKAVPAIRRFIARVTRGALNIDRPRHEVATLTAALEAASSNVDPQKLLEELGGLFRSAQKIDGLVLPLPRSEAVRRWCHYFAEIDRAVPFATVEVFNASRMARLEWLEDVLSLMRPWWDATVRRGEGRADALRRFALDVGEKLYSEMISVLFELESIVQRRELPRRPSFGRKLTDVVSWTRDSLPGVLDPDAAHIRNAGTHNYWRYDLSSQKLLLHDESGWTLSTTMPELRRRLVRMAWTVLDCIRALSWRRVNASFEFGSTPPLPLMFDRAAMADPVRRAAFEAEAIPVIEALLGPLQRRIAEVGWKARYPKQDGVDPEGEGGQEDVSTVGAAPTGTGADPSGATG